MKIDFYTEMLTIVSQQKKSRNISYKDYNENFFDIVQSIFAVGDYYYFTVNKLTFAMEYIHKNVYKVLGYSPESIDLEFAFNCIHPEDKAHFVNFSIEVDNFQRQLPIEKRMKYKTRYDFRVKKADGEYVRILHQGLTIQTDDEGNIIRELMIQTDITDLKKSNVPTLSFIGLDDEPSYIDVEVNEVYKPIKNILSEREKQILILLAEGKSRTKISDQLFISKFTLDNHRKNMLQKTETGTVSELIRKAINDGWI